MFFLGVHKFTPILAILGDTGWQIPKINREVKIIRYWIRMIELKNDRIPKELFIYCYGNRLGGQLRSKIYLTEWN